ncbi:MAG: alpha/beta fold hydrolase [Anaerolineaceae bacterium]|nr:alpha/beta fold hydrolase [Anaerolineaceae bacterium]
MVRRCVIEKKRKPDEPGSFFRKGLKGLFILPLAAAGSWILYSHLGIDHHVPLPKALPGEHKFFTSPGAGKLSYYTQRGGAGRPVVFIHSINAAASAYEMRPLYLHFQQQRPVYALELPGFGFSERSRRVYSPGVYIQAIRDFLSTQVGEPADVVALSLASEFAASAALAEPEQFASLVLISPSGFGKGQEERGSQQASQNGLSRVIHPLFSFPVWARPFFDLLATRQSIEYFLKQSFIGAVPPDLVEYDYAAAHQPGAEHAPLYFISGQLFTPDIRRKVYEQIRVPSLVLYDRDNFVGFDKLPETLANNKFVHAVRLIPTLGLPHFEQPEETCARLAEFWE